jgi:hypothetical protein
MIRLLASRRYSFSLVIRTYLEDVAARAAGHAEFAARVRYMWIPGIW